MELVENTLGVATESGGASEEEDRVGEGIRATVTVVLAVATAWWLLERSEARRLLPPGFSAPRAAPGAGASGPAPATPAPAVMVRRVFVVVGLAGVFFLAVFLPLVSLGSEVAVAPEQLSVPLLFTTHAVLLAGIGLWHGLGFGGFGRRPGADLATQLGLRAARPGQEVALGLLAGLVGWVAVIGVVILAALLLQVAGLGGALPQEQPVMVVWLAGLPAWVRILVSVSAGFFEETFFRGLLQPRLGVAATTVLFVLAHLSYGEPFMLLGIVLLSVFYGLLVRWRQSLWAAIVAHALFDTIQLLVVVPLTLRYAVAP